jgi:hypothetical protein
MLDISVAYNRYKFLGDEFLTWLWFSMEKDHDRLTAPDNEPFSIEIGNRIVLENRINEAVESITIKGDDAGLEEGILSLKKGALVTELNLIYKVGNQEWKFNIKGESLSFSGLKHPDIGVVESGDQVEGLVIEKLFLYEKVSKIIDHLFKMFIDIRLKNEWQTDFIPSIKAWVQSGLKK